MTDPEILSRIVINYMNGGMMHISKSLLISITIITIVVSFSQAVIYAAPGDPTGEVIISSSTEVKIEAGRAAMTQETSINSYSEALKKAVESKKYLFTLFYKGAIDEKYKKLEASVLKFKNSSTAEIMLYSANIADSKEAEAVSKYGLDAGAPMPLALVSAPNGAIVGGMTLDTPESDYSKIIVSRLAMDIMKTVQGRKVALVMLQNKRTKFNEESNKAAEECLSDPMFGKALETLKADPDEPENREFLKQCKLTENDPDAAIVVIVPPASIAAVLKGKTTKNDIMSSLISGGCGSGGCGPGGCK